MEKREAIKMEDGSNWIAILNNFGFPTVVSFYLLLKFEKQIEELTRAVNTLLDTVNRDK